MDIIVNKIKKLDGIIEIPADKSITHRAFIFSALTKGIVKISNFSKGEDCFSTLKIIKSLGSEISFINDKEVKINATNALIQPVEKLNCGNSGTTTRLMMGVLSGQNFNSELYGDESLSKRPMKRVINPLQRMGANILHNDYTLPIRIQGNQLTGIEYDSPLSSAQVKSCILLAGLNANGKTIYREPYKSRNHTELLFQYLNADISVNCNEVIVQKSQLEPKDISVCGDISSASFFIVAGLIVPDSDIVLKNVGTNATRIGIITVLKNMGADIEILNTRIVSNEPVSDIHVRYSNLKSTTIEKDLIPTLIDEIPIIALAATQAEGTTIIKDAQDLRNKETDRIKATVNELQKLGADIQETSDGFIINGKSELYGDCISECFHDHRIAMMEYIAGLITKKPIQIKEFEWVNISFPEFEKLAQILIKN